MDAKENLSKQIAELKAIGYSDDRIDRFIKVYTAANDMSERIMAILNEADGPAMMGAAVSAVCISFIALCERMHPGSGESTKELLIRTLSPMTIADIPAVH